MSQRHAICLVVDGLRAAALGAYGNTIYPTPQLDILASQALVADWLWADSPHLPQFYRSVWQGVHALRPAVANERSSVLDQLQQAGVRQCLVTDDPWLSEHAGSLPFDEALLFENAAEQTAVRLEDTALSQFFSAAIERLHQWREDAEHASSLTWLHCRGFAGPWDAPLELRAALLDDDEDPPPPEFVEPPSVLRDAARDASHDASHDASSAMIEGMPEGMPGATIDDPDMLLGIRVAYAAQVAVLDACVGAFVQAVEAEFAGSETLISLVGSRGFALGEHGSIGIDCTELYSERLHLPWLMVPCGNTTPLPRLTSLAQTADVGATLLEWLGLEWMGVPDTAGLADGISYASQLGMGPLRTQALSSARQLAVATGDKFERVIRTPAWMLRQSSTDDLPDDLTAELYTKPDDRWEYNDIGVRCPEIVQQLRQELAGLEQCAREDMPLPRVPRESELITSSR